jgi:hypothetical protein
LELLARVFPDEYGRREIVPQVEQERPPTLLKVVLNTNGKTLEEITRWTTQRRNRTRQSRHRQITKTLRNVSRRSSPDTAWAGVTAMNLMMLTPKNCHKLRNTLRRPLP